MLRMILNRIWPRYRNGEWSDKRHTLCDGCGNATRTIYGLCDICGEMK
jgi:hypothetical protein